MRLPAAAVSKQTPCRAVAVVTTFSSFVSAVQSVLLDPAAVTAAVKDKKFGTVLVMAGVKVTVSAESVVVSLM
jgi:hypothetical protein